MFSSYTQAGSLPRSHGQQMVVLRFKPDTESNLNLRANVPHTLCDNCSDNRILLADGLGEKNLTSQIKLASEWVHIFRLALSIHGLVFK